MIGQQLIQVPAYRKPWSRDQSVGQENWVSRWKIDQRARDGEIHSGRHLLLRLIAVAFSGSWGCWLRSGYSADTFLSFIKKLPKSSFPRLPPSSPLNNPSFETEARAVRKVENIIWRNQTLAVWGRMDAWEGRASIPQCRAYILHWEYVESQSLYVGYPMPVACPSGRV